LMATPVDDERWYDGLTAGIIFSCVYSLLIVDLIKAVCLTLTSTPALVALGFVSHALAAEEDEADVDDTLKQKKKKARASEAAHKVVERSLAKAARKFLRRVHKMLDIAM